MCGKLATLIDLKFKFRRCPKPEVSAGMKHYVADNMKTRRSNMDEQIDERTLREIYLFKMALKSQPWTVMMSYPKINGEHADTGQFLVKYILREEWGFDRLVMSNWGGLNYTIRSLNAYTDLEAPRQPTRYGKALAEAVRSAPTTEGTGRVSANPYNITTPYCSICETAIAMNSPIETMHDRGIFTQLQPPPIGSIIRTPDGKSTGFHVEFYHGYGFQGDAVATTHWHNSLVYLMSDGDTPAALHKQKFCYQVRGIFQLVTSGTYQLSLPTTGKAKFFIDDIPVIDNTNWTEISRNFMNSGDVEVFATVNLEARRDYNFRIDTIVVLFG
ncbi:glycosyl hydrolase family 3 N terminal domain-containing protein [Bisporella sp. PMI_857]|nr:glycosyl hydrolase family 3 N terminal domain-containing protein [Bisporella sp. PMI_857]